MQLHLAFEKADQIGADKLAPPAVQQDGHFVGAELQVVHHFAQALGAADQVLLLAGSGGFGLLSRASDLHGRQKAGKAFLTLDAAQRPLPPVPVGNGLQQLACLASDGRLLTFALSELKLQPGGGRGLTLMDVDQACPLVSVACFSDTVLVQGSGRAGRARQEQLRGAALASHAGKRARKGHKVAGFVKAVRVL